MEHELQRDLDALGPIQDDPQPRASRSGSLPTIDDGRDDDDVPPAESLVQLALSESRSRPSASGLVTRAVSSTPSSRLFVNNPKKSAFLQQLEPVPAYGPVASRILSTLPEESSPKSSTRRPSRGALDAARKLSSGSATSPLGGSRNARNATIDADDDTPPEPVPTVEWDGLHRRGRPPLIVSSPTSA